MNGSYERSEDKNFKFSGYSDLLGMSGSFTIFLFNASKVLEGPLNISVCKFVVSFLSIGAYSRFDTLEYTNLH